MDRQVVGLAILLYNFGVSFRKVARALRLVGVKRSDVAVWNWVQKFGQRSSEAGCSWDADQLTVLLMDETVIKQRGRSACCLRLLTLRIVNRSTPLSCYREIISQLGDS